MTPDNPTPDDTTTIHELAGAFALDALPLDEVGAFETHVADCADCTEEVTSLQAVAADLAMLAVHEPPREVRESVLAAITSVDQVDAPVATATTSTTDPAAPGLTDTPATTTAGTTTAGTTPDNVVSLDEHRRLRWTTRIATGVAAALALVVGGLGLWTNDLGDQVRDRDQAIEQVASVLNAPDAEIRTGAGASLVLSAQNQQAVFAAGALDAPDSSEVLQMWVIDDSGATSAGLVEDPSRPDLLDIPVPEGALVGVTVEPAGGSDQPTSDPVVVFET